MKREPKNIKEFQALVERYETITLDEIKEEWEKFGCNTANALTGYGDIHTCTLCRAVRLECEECVHGSNAKLMCAPCSQQETYRAIHDAETAGELLSAFRDRAKYLRKTYPQYLKNDK